MFFAYVLTGKSGKESMIIALDDLFPDCQSLTSGTTIPRLSCWMSPGSCDRGSFTTCMQGIVEQCYKIFSGLPNLDLIVLHWKSPAQDAPGGERQWGLIMERDEDKEMKISTLNKWAVDSIEKRVGKKFAISFE
jgi:hypothetical protein